MSTQIRQRQRLEVLHGPLWLPASYCTRGRADLLSARWTVSVHRYFGPHQSTGPSTGSAARGTWVNGYSSYKGVFSFVPLISPFWGDANWISCTLVWDFSPLLWPRSFLPYFLLIFYYYSSVCYFKLLHPYCFYARSILRGIHASWEPRYLQSMH